MLKNRWKMHDSCSASQFVSYSLSDTHYFIYHSLNDLTLSHSAFKAF